MLLPWADDTLAALLGGAASLSTSASAVGPLSDPFSACMLLALAMLLASGDACGESVCTLLAAYTRQRCVLRTGRQLCGQQVTPADRRALYLGRRWRLQAVVRSASSQPGDTKGARTCHR